ncbi:MAG TPA: PH domain-containing protein [Actinomycetota bacterium]|nr:PH domain-containing protein [Actinomycetota bacterium]
MVDRPLPKALTLNPQEKVLLDKKPSFSVTWLQHLFTLGLYHFWMLRTYFVLTDRRVILAKGIISKRLVTVPLEKVQDVTLTTALWLGYVSMSTAGPTGASVEKAGPMRARDANEFIDRLQQLLHGRRDFGGTSAAVVPDLADQIRKLAELKDQGVLTVEEFEAKKKQLLGL